MKTANTAPSTVITDRQLEIIAAAGKILTTAGVSGLTTKNLAATMRFSESALYRHFASKEEIILAMLHHLASDMDQRLAKAIDPNESLEEQLKSLFESQMLFFKEQPHFAVAVFSDGLLEASERINAAMLQLMAVMMKHLHPIVAAGQTSQLFTSELNTAALLHLIMGSFRLLMFKWRISNFQFDIVAAGQEQLQNLFYVLKSR